MARDGSEPPSRDQQCRDGSGTPVSSVRRTGPSGFMTIDVIPPASGGESTKCISRGLILGIALWAVVTAAGAIVLVSYSNSSGDVGRASPRFPTHAGIAGSSERFTLVMFAHPRCPCSKASIEQLARIHARCRDRLEIRVLFFCPYDQPASWVRTGTWDSASRIPGASVAIDPDGQLAAQFGARTSGHVCLYDKEGRLMFHGGITAGRGHEGDNIGTSAVIACVRGERPLYDHAPVFGCSIPAQAGSGRDRSEPRFLPPPSGDRL
ncbi:MAG: RedB protein [Planctomycetaceae bacterium]